MNAGRFVYAKPGVAVKFKPAFGINWQGSGHVLALANLPSLTDGGEGFQQLTHA